MNRLVKILTMKSVEQMISPQEKRKNTYNRRRKQQNKNQKRTHRTTPVFMKIRTGTPTMRESAGTVIGTRFVIHIAFTFPVSSVASVVNFVWNYQTGLTDRHYHHVRFCVRC